MASRENSLSNSHSIASVLSVHLPKYGTRIPNRIFVGGLTGDTTEMELKHLFAAYGSVRDCKIILDRGGVSKSYGFVTFDNQEDADRILRKESENLLFKDRKLNIGQAIRKQQAFPKTYETCLSSAASSVSSYSALPGIQYHTVSTGPGARFMLYCTPDGDSIMVPTTTQNHQGMTLPMMMTPPAYNPQMGSAYYQQSTACGIPSQWTPSNQWRYDVQQIPVNSSVYPTSPYLYPVHAAMLPQESLYPAHMAVPVPEPSNSSGSLVDQVECQYYIGVPPQYSSSALC